MANPNGNPNNLTPWQEGQSGNPAGRPKNPPELTMIRNLKRGELAVILNKILSANPKELDQICSTVIEKWLATVVKHGMMAGSSNILFTLLDRLYGKDATYFQDPSERKISDMTLPDKKDLLVRFKEELSKLEADIKSEEQQIEI